MGSVWIMQGREISLDITGTGGRFKIYMLYNPIHHSLLYDVLLLHIDIRAMSSPPPGQNASSSSRTRAHISSARSASSEPGTIPKLCNRIP